MKKILTSILSVLILALSTPMVCFADSGYCGGTDAKKMTWIYFPGSSTLEINTLGETGCYDMKKFESERDVPWLKYKNDIKQVRIYNVNELSDWSFANCPELTHVYINTEETSIKSIGKHTFENCPKLEFIEMPTGIKYIGDYAFKGCTQLKSIEMPNSITHIGQYAFNNCKKLKTVTLSKKLERIDYGAFYNCTNLNSIELPDSLESIGTEAFGRTGLKSLTLPASSCALDSGAFSSCKKLTTIDMRKWDDSYLGTELFADCSRLTTVYLPKCDTALGDDTFDGCNAIQNIYAYEGYDYEGIPEELMPKVTVIEEEGKTETYGDVSQYITPEGKTIVTINKKDIIWLKEESDGTSAWYGLDNRNGDFAIGSKFYVHWLNEKEHPEAFKNIDENIRKEVNDNNGWLFDVGVIDPDGNPYTTLNKGVKLYVQIGKDWDMFMLGSYYIATGQDTKVPVTAEAHVNYPEGQDFFGVMTLSHFSPYFIYDKLNDKEKAAFDALSDEEKAQLDAAAKELAAQQNEKTEEKSETKSEKNSSSSSPKTGDEITYFTISGLGLMMTLALGLMLNSKINRRKLDK